VGKSQLFFEIYLQTNKHFAYHNKPVLLAQLCEQLLGEQRGGALPLGRVQHLGDRELARLHHFLIIFVIAGKEHSHPELKVVANFLMILLFFLNFNSFFY
jgi:hypothetical protein